MADLGYSVAWRVLDAQYFGVPQRRKRVFIACRRASSGSAGEILFKSEGLRRNPTQSQPQGQDSATSIARSFGQSSFAGYTEGPATITATSYKRPEDNVVVYADQVKTLQARDYKGVGNQYVDENKLVVHKE
jgi:site-specific DNA-cytosine methylase